MWIIRFIVAKRKPNKDGTRSWNCRLDWRLRQNCHNDILHLKKRTVGYPLHDEIKFSKIYLHEEANYVHDYISNSRVNVWSSLLLTNQTMKTHVPTIRQSVNRPAAVKNREGNVTTREITSKFPTLHTLTVLQANWDTLIQSQSRLIRGGHRSWTDSIFGSERFPYWKGHQVVARAVVVII